MKIIGYWDETGGFHYYKNPETVREVNMSDCHQCLMSLDDRILGVSHNGKWVHPIFMDNFTYGRKTIWPLKVILTGCDGMAGIISTKPGKIPK